MTRVFTIAHISDLHLSSEFRRQNIRHVKRLLDFAARRGVDHLVITGDIAANAQEKEFEIARSLLSSYGFLDGERATIIPGNHDIYGGVYTAEDVLEFPARCRRTDVQRSLQLFSEYFRELFRDCQFAGEGISYPFVKDVGPAILLGMNSVAPYSVVKNPVGSNGRVPNSQIDTARTLLAAHANDAQSRIALIHHHFNKSVVPASGAVGGIWGNLEQQTMKLWKKKRLDKFFAEEGIDLVLHGHHHVNAAYVRKGVRFVNAGGSVMGPAAEGLSVNIIAIENGRSSSEFLPVPATSPSVQPNLLREAIPLAIAS